MLHTDFRRENEHIRYIQTLEGENEHEKSLLRMRSPCFNNMRMNDQYRLVWVELLRYKSDNRNRNSMVQGVPKNMGIQ